MNIKFLVTLFTLALCTGLEPAAAAVRTEEEQKLLDRALLDAVISKNLEQTVKALSDGADVNTKNHDKYTPLHFAAKKGQNKIIETLLQHGANINALNQYTETPVYKAAFYNYGPTVRNLLHRGALLDQKILTDAESKKTLNFILQINNFKSIDALITLFNSVDLADIVLKKMYLNLRDGTDQESLRTILCDPRLPISVGQKARAYFSEQFIEKICK